MSRYILRTKAGKGFTYVLDGRKVSKATISRIASLAIPPAWTDVQISVSDKAKVQATGYDNAGRKQYIYSKAHTTKQEAQKFDRILDFASNLPKLRKQVEKDLKKWRFTKNKVTAAAVSLMDDEYFRVGNHAYARQNKTFGLTTLRSKHLTITGNKVVFDFVGKSGQKHHKVIQDIKISNIIKKLDDMPGYEVFRYYDANGQLHNLSPADVNDYIKSVIGDEFSAKDFRTWGGTLLATVELAASVRPATKTARKAAITRCVKKVAKKLGNTPAIAKASYVDPRVLKTYENSDGIAEVYGTVRAMRPKKYISRDEAFVMKVLSK